MPYAPEDLANGAQAAFTRKIVRYGSTVNLSGGVTLKAFIETNERELLKQLNIDGERPSKVYTGFLFDATSKGKVTEGTRFTSGGRAYNVDLLHSIILSDVLIYIATGCYQVG